MSERRLLIKSRRERYDVRGDVVGLSETFSKNYKIIRDYVKNHASTPVNTDVDPAITDQSYNPDYIVKSIKQQQKVLPQM